MAVLPERTARFETFVAPARVRPALWRLVAGSALAAAVWLAGGMVLLGLATGRSGPDADRLRVLAFLATFGGLVVGLGLAARLLHRRGLASLVGPGGFRPRAFALGFAVVALFAVPGALALAAVDPPTRQTGLADWARWLPLALPLVMVQTAAEELTFRGYLMQGLAARFQARAVWWALPALLFGLLHWSPGEFGPNAGLVVLSACLIGLILGDVTARSGNLSLAMGLHFANNAIALLIVAMPSPLAALSLYVTPAGPADVAALRRLLLLDFAVTLAAYGVWLAFCARRGRLHSRGPGSI